ncbi:phospho-2-dehydro-3-deoxyheptonate aldolase [Sorangium cellulosum]|uniref:Phospho-2-dehydro-3-deoxyheptonate aldolase n=1 Tax=Sorangium cellulosum TaxID=56 RepID=A0A4V0ND79_SORCE|nr:phospho-2-dehydro-3-deoxyheptonate aldolase [Sorangium cellulosum]
MYYSTDDLRIAGLRPLIPPAILIEEIPVSPSASETVTFSRKEAERVITGDDDRLLVVVGPCSIHDPKAALEYAERLREARDRLSDDLLVVMRVYFEKPRTTVGWKGLINDPNLDGSFSINKGLRVARGLLRDIAELGLASGTEFLDTITPQFIADLIAWGAIGARTTESQVHRELASGLSCPVGFKNSTEGDVQIAVDAVRAAREAHHFLSVTKQGISAIVATRGNAACHVILRGSQRGPNYSAEHVREAADRLTRASLPRRLMVDCSHGNSQKDPARQRLVAESLAEQLRAGSRDILGVMIESHLVGGRQDFAPGRAPTYGQSITDACLGWSDTVPVLELLAQAVRARRASKAA